ncbi:MAG: glycoside hydrolase family 43 protein [Clostridia bacterium]|nr:glycoside hydrolase family 43 protein [Clostridia bacterium]
MRKTIFYPLPILLLSLLLLFFSACGDKMSAETDPSAGQAAGQGGAENVEAVPAAILAKKGETAYTLVRPDKGEPDELAGAQVIFAAFSDNYDVRIPFGTDYVRPGDDPNAVNAYEICVGRTNRSADTEPVYERLGDNEFAIAFGETRVIVIGRTPVLTKIAAEVFVRDYLNGDECVLKPGEIMTYQAEPQYETITFKNPVAPSGADPWVIRDPDTGRYYYCYSGGNGVCVNEITDLAHITAEGGTKVYTAPENTMYSAEYWAPELHKIDGKWYIYVAADDGDNFNHRMYVLECTGDKPTDKFNMVGKITDPTDKWAIDGTVARIDGELYFVWSGWEGNENVAQNIYIAHMKSPTAIDSERTVLSKPKLRWEKLGGMPSINEGPVALAKGETVHIIYSASGSWSDFYNLGKLTWRGGDPLDAENWTKSDVSVFEKTATCFGPGHCSFTTAADGTTWIVYHGNLVSGSGWGGRSVWTQPISWDGDEPILGSPIGPRVEIELPVAGYSADHVTPKP